MKTITYDEATHRLVPVEPDERQMETAAFNLCSEFGSEFVAKHKRFALAAHWELTAAAPQPETSRMLAGWEMSPADMKSVGQELIDAAEAMSGGEADCDLILSVVPEGGFVDDDGVSNTHPILLVLCVDAEQEGGYPIDPWDTAPRPECVEQAANDASDAARWRYIRRKLCLNGNGDGTCSMHAINLPAACQGWPELGAVSEFCDAAIDAAIYASQEPSHDDQ